MCAFSHLSYKFHIESIKHNEVQYKPEASKPTTSADVPVEAPKLVKEDPVAVALPPKSPKEEVTSVSFSPSRPSIQPIPEEPTTEPPSIITSLDLKGVDPNSKEKEREEFLPIRRTQSSSSFSGTIGKRRESGQQPLLGSSPSTSGILAQVCVYRK